MKNSLPIMKNRIIPVRMSEKLVFNSKTVAISPAPRSRNTSKKLVRSIAAVLNFDIQLTMTAVKPRPPARVVVIVWFVPATRSNPARPHKAPLKAAVRIMTDGTLIPRYLAVLSLSPTTESS